MVNSLSLLLDFNLPLLVLCSMDLWDCCRVFHLLQSLSKTPLLEEKHWHLVEALTPAMVKALIRAVYGLPTTLRNLGTIQCDSWLARNVKGALALSGSGGFRLAEVSLVDGTDFSALKMSRASLYLLSKTW